MKEGRDSEDKVGIKKILKDIKKDWVEKNKGTL